MAEKRLRLLHLQVQPVYVIDDGEHLTTQPGEPFTVASVDVPGFSEVFVADLAVLQEKFATGQLSEQPLTAD